MSSGTPTISMADFKRLQAAGQTRIKEKGSKKAKKKIDYETLCLLPKWKATTSFNITQYKLPMPPSANKYWRHVVIKGYARVLVSEEARQYKTEVGKLAKRLGMPLLTGPVQITIQMFRAQKSGDLSNRIKVIEDALRGIAYVDDEQVCNIVAMRYESPADPYILISVAEIGK